MITLLYKLLEYLYLNMPNNLAYYDQLTSCKNRLWYDRICKVKYNDRLIGVTFVDIDNLKLINDIQGHAYGSMCIQNIALKLKSLDGVDEVVRLGGDEFIIIGNINTLQLNDIPEISYGFCIKDQYESVVSAVIKADGAMYIHKISKRQSQINVI